LTHHEQTEIASRLHDQAELELGLSNPDSIKLERLASNLEDRRRASLIDQLTASFDWLLSRASERT
jgi:hypothetical protein